MIEIEIILTRLENCKHQLVRHVVYLYVAPTWTGATYRSQVLSPHLLIASCCGSIS